VAQRTGEITSPSGASPLGKLKAIEAAVIGQTSMNLDDSGVMLQPRLKTDLNTQRAAFARTLSGTLVPNAHPLLRPNKPGQYDPVHF